MVVMSAITILVVSAGIAWLILTGRPMPMPFLVAVAAGAAGSLMLAAALMGLLFFSNSSGMDEEVGRDDRT
jgi:hypothetical protein